LFERFSPDALNAPAFATEEAYCYQFLAKFERRTGSPLEAIKFATRAVDQFRAIAKVHPGVFDCHHRLAMAIVDLGIALGKAGRYDDAVLAFRDAGNEAEEAFRITPNDEARKKTLDGINRNIKYVHQQMRDQALSANEPR
jgi:hypothetical protein